MRSIVLFRIILISSLFNFPLILQAQSLTFNGLKEIERNRVLSLADSLLKEEPVTVTSVKAIRSTGGVHDYFSEGTYWWPDPKNPEGPYIRKDGLNNPENFTAHSNIMEKFSINTSALTAAYKLTGDRKYALRALKHIKAWFINDETLMNPNLLYAQAIKGVVPGRGIGIIDAVHLIEVARSVMILEQKGILKGDDLTKVKKWFSEFLSWMTTHKYGTDERDNGNNHSTWWAAQAAIYAKLTGNIEQMKFLREFYKTVLLPKQMAPDGNFPQETSRTKPYSYSMFNLEGFALICKILSGKDDDLFEYKTDDGRGLKKAVEFMYPYLKDKTPWPYKKDVVNFDKLPVRTQALLFCGLAYKENKYTKLWKTLNTDYNDEELIRTFPIRQPLLWLEDSPK